MAEPKPLPVDPEWRSHAGKIDWRETHDPYQFRTAQNISPTALETLTKRGLFTALLTFFKDTRNAYLNTLAHGKKHLTNVGGSAQQLLIPPHFLADIPDIDPEKPLNFAILDFDYDKSLPIVHKGDFKVVVNRSTSPLPDTRYVLGFEACHSFPIDSTGARISCLTRRPEALQLSAIISDDGMNFEQKEGIVLNESLSQLVSHEDGHRDGKAFGDKAERRFVVTQEREEEYVDLLIVAKRTGNYKKMKWDLEISKENYEAYMEQIKNGHAPRLLDYV